MITRCLFFFFFLFYFISRTTSIPKISYRMMSHQLEEQTIPW